MIKSLEQKKKLIELLKGKNPAYAEILGFYEKVIEAQDAEKADVSVAALHLHNNVKSLQTSEGFPLIDRKDFILDIPSSVRLFESLCRISRNANEKMRENIQAIEEASAINALNLRELLRRHSDESYLNSIAEEFTIDRAILLFLVTCKHSTFPQRQRGTVKGSGRSEKLAERILPGLRLISADIGVER